MGNIHTSSSGSYAVTSTVPATKHAVVGIKIHCVCRTETEALSKLKILGSHSDHLSFQIIPLNTWYPIDTMSDIIGQTNLYTQLQENMEQLNTGIH